MLNFIMFHIIFRRNLQRNYFPQYRCGSAFDCGNPDYRNTAPKNHKLSRMGVHIASIAYFGVMLTTELGRKSLSGYHQTFGLNIKYHEKRDSVFSPSDFPQRFVWVAALKRNAILHSNCVCEDYYINSSRSSDVHLSINHSIIASDNYFSPFRCQAVIRANLAILLIDTWGHFSMQFESKYNNFYTGVSKMSSPNDNRICNHANY